VSTHILFTRHERVGVITLNRPERLNAFAGTMRIELVDALRAAADDTGIGALVITGAGRAFCAGADVAWMYDLVTREDWDTLNSQIQAGAEVIQIIDALEKPVLAAVNGVAAGGGANLALACDIRIAAKSASIGQSFTRLGLQPDWGGTYLLPRLIGTGRALELVLTADMVSASDAQQLGLFNRDGGADRRETAAGYRTRPAGGSRRERHEPPGRTGARAAESASPAQDSRSARCDARLSRAAKAVFTVGTS